MGWNGVVLSLVVDRRPVTPGFDEPYTVARMRPVESKNQRALIPPNMRDCTFEDMQIDIA